MYFYNEKYAKNATSVFEKKDVVELIILTTIKLNNLIDKYNGIIKLKKFNHINCEIIYEDWTINWINSDSC